MDERERPATELLDDTEAALRLVNTALDEGCGPGGPPGSAPSTAAPGQPAALALVRQPEPPAHPPRPALAAELADILDDVRLGRALLDRARSRRAFPCAAEESSAASTAIGNQYVDGAAHLLGELEHRVARLAESLRGGERPTGK